MSTRIHPYIFFSRKKKYTLLFFFFLNFYFGHFTERVVDRVGEIIATVQQLGEFDELAGGHHGKIRVHQGNVDGFGQGQGREADGRGMVERQQQEQGRVGGGRLVVRRSQRGARAQPSTAWISGLTWMSAVPPCSNGGEALRVACSKARTWSVLVRMRLVGSGEAGA